MSTAAEIAAAEQARNDELEASVGIEDQHNEPEYGEPRATRIEREEEPAPRAIQKSPSDMIREQIASRFKRDGEVPFDGDMNNPENLYGDVARQELEPDPDAPEPGVPVQAKPAPKMVTLKVRGQDVTMTEDEVLARAAKVTAADSYLEEARTFLEGAKQVKAERAGRDHQHPDGQSSTQNDEPDLDAPRQQRHPAADTLDVVKDLQFGDPEEAAAKLDRLIDARAEKQANEGHLSRLVNNDLAKSQKALADFTAANPDLANDKNAAVLIENTIYDLYREEISKLGIDEAQIPKNPKELADWHRFYRINGHAVSTTPAVLEQAKQRVMEWRGTTAPPKQPAKTGSPRVEVDVDRTARRAAIPNQPNRAVSARRDAPSAPPQNAASNTIAEMRKARGQI